MWLLISFWWHVRFLHILSYQFVIFNHTKFHHLSLLRSFIRCSFKLNNSKSRSLQLPYRTACGISEFWHSQTVVLSFIFVNFPFAQVQRNNLSMAFDVAMTFNFVWPLTMNTISAIPTQIFCLSRMRIRLAVSCRPNRIVSYSTEYTCSTCMYDKACTISSSAIRIWLRSMSWRSP